MGNSEKLSSESMGTTIQEILGFFAELKGALESSDEKTRAEAVEFAADLKKKLELQALNLCKSIGVDPEELKTYFKDQSHFSPQDWQVMEQAKTEINEYNETYKKLNIDESVHKKTKIKPKSVKNWVIG